MSQDKNADSSKRNVAGTHKSTLENKSLLVKKKKNEFCIFIHEEM